MEERKIFFEGRLNGLLDADDVSAESKDQCLSERVAA